MKNSKHLGLRADDALHGKLKHIAEYEGRSMNGQVTYLIQECIRAFEKEHGVITDDDLNNGKSS